jgi:hypothetical protein
MHQTQAKNQYRNHRFHRPTKKENSSLSFVLKRKKGKINTPGSYFSQYVNIEVKTAQIEDKKTLNLVKMEVMNQDRTKLEIMRLLLKITDEKALLRIKKVLEDEYSDWWDDLTTEEKQEIQLGLDQADRGELSDLESVMKRFDPWR